MPFLIRAAFPYRAFAAAALAATLALAALAALPRPAGKSAGTPRGAVAAASSRAPLLSLPVAAQGPASAALGASSSAYLARAEGGDRLLLNPRQRIAARFSSTGATFSTAGLRVRMRLLSIDRRRATAAAPASVANRVSYDRGGATEWYANGPLGVEQGFTIARPPASRGGGLLTIAVGLSGDAAVTLAPGGRGLRLGGRGGGSLRIGDLLASDATGRALHSRFELRAGTLLIRVQSAGARYPLRVDPLVQQGAKLTAGGEEGGGELGTSVAISSDGNTALVGGPGDEAGKEPMVGATWVFVRTGATWTQQGPKLTGGGEHGEGQFGISVALSGDGNTALVGAINDESAGKQLGAAWVFVRSGSTWSQQGAKLTGTGETLGGRFGRSVALSSDGNTALVGGYFDEGMAGSAWVFTRAASTWTQQGPKLTGGGETGEGQFGFSAALSANGNTALIGAPHDNGETGATWVFARSGTSWAQQGAKLTAGDESGPGELGAGVALSADGNTALAGGPGDGSGGSAWTYVRSGATWTQQGPKLAASDESGTGAFGSGVALSADGNTALIGAPIDLAGPKEPTGAAWEFARTGSTWSQQGAKIRGSGAGPEREFGLGVALSADGDTALVGGPIDNTDLGAAWAFVDPPPAATTEPAGAVTAAGAILNGTVAAGASSVARFEYGATTAYGASTASLALPASAAAHALAATVGALAPATTYHFRVVAENSAGTSVGADQTFTTQAAAVLLGHPEPLFAGSATESHRVWREGARLASVARAHRPPVGTTFSFTLGRAATVTLSFTGHVAGRSVGGRCVAPRARNRKHHACRRAVGRGSLSLTGHAGTDRVAFQGRLSRTRKLPLGSYTVQITARAGGALGSTPPLAFTIVR